MHGTVEYLMMLREVEGIRSNRKAREATARRNEMEEQRMPNLEEMDEREAHHFLTDLCSRHIPEEEYNVRHPEDYMMEMPQSGERFRGRENMRAFQEAHPTPPASLRVSRVLVKEILWVVEGMLLAARSVGNL